MFIFNKNVYFLKKMKDITTLIKEASSNRRDILRRKLTEFVKTIYNDGNDLVVGSNVIANIMDDGGIVFPKKFSPELAKFIVQCYIYGHSDWETDESDYYVCLGDPNRGGTEIEW